MLLKIILTIALLINLTNGQFYSCDSSKLNSCTQQYFVQALNYPITDNSQIWLDYSTFINFTDQLISQNIGDPSGLVALCNAMELTSACTTSASQFPYECFTEYGFLKRGADQTTAVTFAGLWYLYSFRCSAGLYTLLRENLSCVQRTLWNYRNVLRGCLNTFQVNTQHNPGESCKYVQDYVNCYSAVFNRTTCGFAGSADHWWACEGAYRLTQAGFPTCYAQCSRERSSPEFEEYLKEHVKIEDNETWFKLPNIWKNIQGNWQYVENEWMKKV